MTGPPLPAPGVDTVAGLFERGEFKSCCAATYEQPVVRWLLGGELHPGGERLTRRALALASAAPGERLLDVASGTGISAMLAARERGCETVGLDYGLSAVAEARTAAAEQRLSDRVRFVEGDAEALPFADAEFDVVVCECSLCTFPDKPRAAAEMRRVLRPGGRVAIADVVAEQERLPSQLRSAAAAVACVAEALPVTGYEELLRGAGLDPLSREPHDEALLAMLDTVESRLRGARVLGLAATEPFAGMLERAIELTSLARGATEDGALGYAILTARVGANDRSSADAGATV
ncbi:MAG TPA: methyltransferase domain-containing protein [Solirubrobacterales bacterium]|jgi:SAM-dependent methyltransferase|nr:methyltransferase domain-containing protein [Solirubrobacterales bacterium]